MAAILMSSTEFAQQMEEAGIPRAQADVIAKGLATMVVHNFDALVTKDYLDTRFGEFEARMGREMDRRFVEVDQRFVALESQMDKRYAGLEAQMQLGFADVETRFAGVNVMLVIIMAALAVPVLQAVLTWTGS